MPQHNANALIVVAKRPAPGKAKTRLCPPLTAELASGLYESFLLDTLDQMRQVRDAQHIIAYLDEPDYFQRLAPDFELIPQEGSNLGSRLDNALTSTLSRGYERVTIMDSDSPTLPADYLSQAFRLLSDGADVVLGPCDDGGYYLIGSTRPVPRLLREVQMSTPTVMAETIALAEEMGLSLVTLPAWYDIDDVASLSRLIREFDGDGSARAAHTRRFVFDNEIALYDPRSRPK
jgi:rSAM/selenodomain-associated transferase 1